MTTRTVATRARGDCHNSFSVGEPAHRFWRGLNCHVRQAQHWERDVAEKLERRQTPQTIAWFRDLHKRGLLDLDPPYQRRSVWNQKYREFFIETVLLHYPAPPIFLHEDISSDGSTRYAVVDGKQRLTTVFDFAEDLFPVASDSIIQRHQGKYFSQLDGETKRSFWTYQSPVEFLPAIDEGLLTNIFDRINRNVARLTRQELRHARFDGPFSASAEELTEVLAEELPVDAPRIAKSSRRQMKDVEFTAQLLLLVENGPQSFSQDDLDQAYSDRDEIWESRRTVERQFRRVLAFLQDLFEQPALLQPHSRRIRNQADFYSLFGAVLELNNDGTLPAVDDAAERLSTFLSTVGDDVEREKTEVAKRYYQAARSASNDLRQRTTRIAVLKAVLSGDSST
jgi:hypothetical protein